MFLLNFLIALGLLIGSGHEWALKNRKQSILFGILGFYFMTAAVGTVANYA